MKNLAVKQKMVILKVAGVALCAIFLFGLGWVLAYFDIGAMWKTLSQTKFSDIGAWLSLIGYRICVYLLPAIILSLYPYDKRLKWMSRFIIWLNWTFFIYLISKAVFYFLAFNLVLDLELFENLDNIVLLMGYILTYINKRKIDLGTMDPAIGKLKQ